MGEEKSKEKGLAVRPEKIMAVSAELIDPEEQVKWGQKAAKALVAVISTKKKPVMMNGEQYLEYEDWQVLARFYNYTVGTDWTKEVNRDGKLQGFESKAVVYNIAGAIVSSAEASCLRDEPKWNMRAKYKWENNRRVKIGEEQVPEFQLKSMSQTRACAKALRNVLAWVVILAGYKPTPAEEIDNLIISGEATDPGPYGHENVGEYGEPVAPVANKPAPSGATEQKPSLISAPGARAPYAGNCHDCKMPITLAVSKYSQDHYNTELCQPCQKKYKQIR